MGGIFMRKRLLSALLAGTLILGMGITASAAASLSEQEIAAAYVCDRGIMTGDQNGDLNLKAGLNRAELAVLLVRLRGGLDDLQNNSIYYEMSCIFSDVPAWAAPYVGYCVSRGLLTGYDARRYGAADPVTPAAACAAILRVCGMGDNDLWNYSTACSYAANLGWLDERDAHAAVMTRGRMAVLIFRAMSGTEAENMPAVCQGTGDGYLTNGKPVTEENVLEILRQLETDWPSGTIWGRKETPGTHKNEVPGAVAKYIMDTMWVNGIYGCGGYAAMVSSLIFGDKTNPARKVDDLLQLRPGDILFLVNNKDGSIWHVMVALESPDEIHAYHITDGNCGGTVQWPNRSTPYGKQNLDCFQGESRSHHIEAWTRYPENVPYTGNSIGAWPTGISN